MEKNCRDIFVAYRLGKCHDKFLPSTIVVARVIGTHTILSYSNCKVCLLAPAVFLGLHFVLNLTTVKRRPKFHKHTKHLIWHMLF